METKNLKTKNFIEVRDLNFSYPDLRVLKDISFTIGKGEFVVLCGHSGCGKTTLIRQFKSTLAPTGEKTGNIIIDGTDINEMSLREQTKRIGFVLQSPDNQIVTDKVWHELAFAMESLGYDTAAIRQRVAEMAQFFGIEEWFHKNVNQLSGGQKQLLNLASVMTLSPDILVLDEPTGQLDPIAAADFLNELSRINRELGTTIILIEQRLEEALPMATKVIVMDEGSIICAGDVRTAGNKLRDSGSDMYRAMPAPMRVWSEAEDEENECPVTVSEGRNWLEAYADTHEMYPIPDEIHKDISEAAAIKAMNLWYRFDRDSEDIIRGLSLTVHKGEFAVLLGGNGSGKSTTLKILYGLRKPYRGEAALTGKTAMLPQDPKTLFVKKSVREDLLEMTGDEAAIRRIIGLCRLGQLMDRNPFDLSGGEMQRLALAKVLLTDPDILLMDEPTKGIDAGFKEEFGAIIRELTGKGITVLMVSHDVEFAACHADKCMLLFDGSIVSEGSPRRFFSCNNFYTTAANRMARHVAPEAVTTDELIAVCTGRLPETAAGECRKMDEHKERGPVRNDAVRRSTDIAGKSDGRYDENPVRENDGHTDEGIVLHREKKKLPVWKKAASAVCIAVIAVVMAVAMTTTDFTELISDGQLTGISGRYIILYGLLILAMLTLAILLGKKGSSEIEVQRRDRSKGLTKGNIITLIAVLVCIPLTIYLCTNYLENRQYYITSLAVMLECMIPLFAAFEGRRPKARELVLIAVLTAIGVIGRIAFGMLPNFNPVIAITVIAGISLGGEVGFITGAMTMLVSNFVFAQGPWTPWQMFAMGLIGLLSGIIFRNGSVSRTKAAICIFGAVAAVIIYGGIMNPAAAIIWQGYITREMLMTYYLMGLPVDLINAAASAIFLWLGAEPMIEKLERIKVKYGLI